MVVKSGESSGRLPVLSFAGSALAIVFYLCGEAMFELLAWRLDWWERGEVWRVFSGHFVHVSAEHLGLDVGAFFVLGWFVETRSRRLWGAVVCGTVFVSGFFLQWTQQYSVYCGLSGMGLGLFVASAFLLLGQGRSKKDWLQMGIGGVGLLLALGKLGREMSLAEAVFLEGGLGSFSVAVEAHVAGFAVGAVCAGGRWFREGRKS